MRPRELPLLGALCFWGALGSGWEGVGARFGRGNGRRKRGRLVSVRAKGIGYSPPQMLNEEQVAAELDNALGALEKLLLDCSTETLKNTFVQDSMKRISDHLLDVLPERSPARPYIEQASLWPNTVWGDSYGFVSQRN